MSDSLQTHGLITWSMEFSRPECWSGQPFPSPGDLPNPGIEPSSPTLQVDSLPAETPGKPKNTGVGSLSLHQQIFPTQESTGSSTLRVNSLLTELPGKPLKFFEQLLNCFLPRMGTVRLQGLASKSCIFYQLFSRIVESAEIYNNSNRLSTHSETQEKHEYILISLLAICISAFYTVIKNLSFLKSI